MSAPDFTLVNFDDWEALYCNGEKIIEGHHVTVQDVIRETDFAAMTGCRFDFKYVGGRQLAKIQADGWCPDRLSDLDV